MCFYTLDKYMKTTLIIMAAGIGSRFGEGIKQLAEIGPNGEIIMDYSIYDAIEAGFNKIVFIIRKDIEQEFKQIIGDRIKEQIEVDYVFQELADIPQGYDVPEGRTKPWGTGQAVLCCKDIVNEPFVIINADDYYGKEAFHKLHNFLVSEESQDGMGMAGFILKNTLSDNGTVTRGICLADENDILTKVVETTGIQADMDGQILCDNEEVKQWIHPDVKVSMNMWAAYPKFFEHLEEGFHLFLQNLKEDSHKKEYLLPNIVDYLIQEKEMNVKVLETKDHWFGITYKEDKQAVKSAFSKLIAEGMYPEQLWA